MRFWQPHILFLSSVQPVPSVHSLISLKVWSISERLSFGIPSIIAVYLTRAFIVPAIPNEIFSIGNFTLTKSILLMLLFAILMIFTSYSMIKKEKDVTDEPPQKQQFNYL